MRRVTRELPLVARRITEVRESKNLSRQELGAEVGLTYLQVYRIEKGQTDVSAEMVSKIADALGASPAAFYRESKAAS